AGLDAVLRRDPLLLSRSHTPNSRRPRRYPVTNRSPAGSGVCNMRSQVPDSTVGVGATPTPRVTPDPRVRRHQMTRSLRAVAIAAATATSLTLGLAVAGAQTTEPAAESIPTVPSSSPPDATAPVPSAPVNSAPLTTLPSPSLVSDGVDEDLAELARLSEGAGALGGEPDLAREELDRATRERDRLERAAGVAASRSALADGGAQRDQSTVDQLATMRYRGGDTGATRAAVLAESPRDLVHRLDTLRRLSGATTSALDASRAAS